MQNQNDKRKELQIENDPAVQQILNRLVFPAPKPQGPKLENQHLQLNFLDQSDDLTQSRENNVVLTLVPLHHISAEFNRMMQQYANQMGLSLTDFYSKYPAYQPRQNGNVLTLTMPNAELGNAFFNHLKMNGAILDPADQQFNNDSDQSNNHLYNPFSTKPNSPKPN